MLSRYAYSYTANAAICHGSMFIPVGLLCPLMHPLLMMGNMMMMHPLLLHTVVVGDMQYKQDGRPAVRQYRSPTVVQAAPNLC